MISLAYMAAGRAIEPRFLLDVYPSAVPCFWLPKQLKTGFTGDIVLVEEMSTNTTQAFQFDANGIFPSAAVVEYADSRQVRVRRLYDGQGSGRYLDFGTGTQCPILVETGGALVTLDGQPSLRFTGTEYGELAGLKSEYAFIHNGGMATTFTRFMITGAAWHDVVSTGSSASDYGMQLSSYYGVVYTRAIKSQVVAHIYNVAYEIDQDIKVDWIQKWDSENATAASRLSADVNGDVYANNAITATDDDDFATGLLTVGASGSDSAANRLVGKFNGFLAWNGNLLPNKASILTYL